MLKPFLAVIALVLSPPGFAGVLYYGGDPDATLGLGLVSGTDGRPIGPLTLSKATVYDDFVVPAGGWTITGLGGHFATEVPTAYWLTWEIRTAMSEGVGGTLVTQGQSTPTVTPDGFDYGQTGHYVEVALPTENYDAIELGPGTYWLGLYWNNWIVHPGTIPYVRGTSGANGVGGPFTNGSYWNAPDFGIDFHNPAGDVGITNVDVSYRILGVSGVSSIPEPGSWLLVITGLGLAVIGPRRWRRQVARATENGAWRRRPTNSPPVLTIA